MTIKFKKLVPDAIVPKYAHQGDAGMDLYAAEDTFIRHGDAELIHTGIAIELPDGYEAQVRSRSGLALKNQVFVLNSPGTIDSNYRGEIGVILANFGNKQDIVNERGDAFAYGPADFNIHKGDRIAQLVIAPVTKAELVEVAELDETDRGKGGFGSTGV